MDTNAVAQIVQQVVAAQPHGMSMGEIISLLLAIGMFLIALFTFTGKTKVKVSDEVKIGPQPLTVELVEQFVTKEEFKDHVDFNNVTHRDLFSKIGGVERGRDAKISTEIGAVHNRVNAIEKAVGGLEVATNLQNNQLARIDAKLDRLAEGRIK